MHLFLFADSTFNITTLYYMATMVRTLLLAAKGARFSCNDQALLARWKMHVQSVLNLKTSFGIVPGVQLADKWYVHKALYSLQ